MTWLETLKMRITAVLPITQNPTQQTVFREWLAIIDEVEKEQAALARRVTELEMQVAGPVEGVPNGPLLGGPDEGGQA